MMDIVQTVRAAFAREVVPALSRMLEEPPKKVQAAVAASIPTVALLLSGKASEVGSARQLLGIVNERGPAILDHVAQQVRDGEAHVHSALGMRRLNSLLGRDSAEGLAYAVSRFSGLTPDSARVIAGLAAAACLESIGRQIAPRDARSLADHLSARQSAYADAVPAGMYEYLQAVPPLRELADRRSEATPEMPIGHAFPTYDADPDADDDLEAMAGDTRIPRAMAWAIPLLIVLAIGAAMVFTLYPHHANNPITVSRPVPQPQPVEDLAQIASSQLTPAPPFGFSDLAYVEDALLRQNLSDAFARLSNALHGVRDAQTAANAAVELEHVSQTLREAQPAVASLPADSRTRVAEEIRNALPAIMETLDTAAIQPHGQAILPPARQVIQQFRQLSTPPGRQSIFSDHFRPILLVVSDSYRLIIYVNIYQ